MYSNYRRENRYKNSYKRDIAILVNSQKTILRKERVLSPDVRLPQNPKSHFQQYIIFGIRYFDYSCHCQWAARFLEYVNLDLFQNAKLATPCIVLNYLAVAAMSSTKKREVFASTYCNVSDGQQIHNRLNSTRAWWIKRLTDNEITKHKKLTISTFFPTILVWNLSCCVAQQMAVEDASTVWGKQCNFDQMHQICISQRWHFYAWRTGSKSLCETSSRSCAP